MFKYLKSMCYWDFKGLTLSVIITRMNAVARQRDILMLIFHGLQEGDQALMVRQLLCHWKRDHHHVDRGFALSERSEQRGNGPIEILHSAFRGGWCVTVVPRVAHA